MQIDSTLQPQYNLIYTGICVIILIFATPIKRCNMTEKYKIYLSDDTKSRLINDAELFEFTKKDESVNLNSFLKTLIVNYFDRYRHDSENLLSNIKQDLTSITSISEKNAALLADKIISTYIKTDSLQNSKNSALTLTVSGSSYEILKIIENNMLKDTSLSQYLKDMFNSYLSIPRSERENIIFKDTYEDISKALKDHRILSFTNTTSGEEKAFRVEPYIIAPSKEEQWPEHMKASHLERMYRA